MSQFIKWLVRLLIIIFVVLCIGWFGVKYYFTHVQRIADRVRSDVYTQVQAHHSRLLAYNAIPRMYRIAVIATEDRSFLTNIGINFRGTLRAVIVDVRNEQPLQGGSTITQQLVHNTLLRDTSKSFEWKLLESIYAIGLYNTMSKQETFALYANDIYFGQGANGLYQAAEIYFGKTPSQLNAGELTMLAGLPNAPSDYDPFQDMTLARERQHLVVQSMIDDGVINESEAKQILSEPIVLS